MSLTKATYSMIDGAIINVFDFGATGDGVTDDTAAIQAAINYAEASATPPSAAPGVVEIYFPFGFYLISDDLVVTKSLSFSGEGHSEYSTGARIVQETAATNHFTVQPISAGCSVSWDNLTFIADGNGATNGACISIEKTAATCNSVRIRGCTFGTPQSLNIKIQSSNDIMIYDNLFDVSSQNNIQLGTSTAGDVVSDCAIIGNTFFALPLSGVSVYNVDGLIISNNRIYPAGPLGARLNIFLDGTNTLPYQIKNIVVQGNTFNSVNCLMALTGVEGLVVNGNNGIALGSGTGATFSAVELVGACSNVAITGNMLSGTFDTENFYNDSGATVAAACISGNSFDNTGGTGAALVCGNTTGAIGENACTGFATVSVGEHFYTTGTAISPGTLGAVGSYTFTKTVTGVRQGDQVQLSSPGTVWPVPVGIAVNAFSSGPNAVSIRYDNPTAAPIGVPAHDFGFLITR